MGMPPPAFVRCENCQNTISALAGRCQFCGAQRQVIVPQQKTSLLDAAPPAWFIPIGVWAVGLWFAIPALLGIKELLASGAGSLGPSVVFTIIPLAILGARAAGGIGLIAKQRWGHNLVFFFAFVDLVLSGLSLFTDAFSSAAAATIVFGPLLAFGFIATFFVAILGVALNLGVLWFLDKVEKQMQGHLG